MKTLSVTASLLDRAKALEEIVNRIAEETHLNKHFSAASKVAWFATPVGWTMYDSRTRATIGETDFVRYYQILDRLGFRSWCDAARRVCSNIGSDLYPERVFDKLLYILGSKNILIADLEPYQIEMAENLAELPEGSSIRKYLQYRCRMK